MFEECIQSTQFYSVILQYNPCTDKVGEWSNGGALGSWPTLKRSHAMQYFPGFPQVLTVLFDYLEVNKYTGK
jgi:hypothetical protein